MTIRNDVILWPELVERMNTFIVHDGGYTPEIPIALFQCPLCLNTHVCLLSSAIEVYRPRKSKQQTMWREDSYLYCSGTFISDGEENIKEARRRFGQDKIHKIIRTKEATVINGKIVRQSI